MTYISTSDLSRLLGLQPAVMPHWPAELRPATVMPRLHRYRDVNEWLAEPGRAHGFDIPPTIEQMISGEITLVLRERAAQMLTEGLELNDPLSYIGRRIANGRLESLLLRPYTWVVSVRSVQRLIAERQELENDFTLEETSHIFGIRGTSLVRVRQRGLVVYRPKDSQFRRVTRQSARALLQELLTEAGSPLSPDDWIDDRESSSEPLMTVPQVAATLGLIKADVRQLLKEGKLAYIPSPEGSKWFISPESVAFYKENAQPLAIAEQAKIFGVLANRVSTWRGQGLLNCPLHPHEPLTMYTWCIVAYLKDRVGPGVDPARWVRNALAPDGRKIWHENHLLHRKVLTRKQLEAAVAAGRIPMLIAPSGSRFYIASAVKREARRYR